jgi:hypothetical protein
VTDVLTLLWVPDAAVAWLCLPLLHAVRLAAATINAVTTIRVVRMPSSPVAPLPPNRELRFRSDGSRVPAPPNAECLAFPEWVTDAPCDREQPDRLDHVAVLSRHHVGPDDRISEDPVAPHAA